MFRECRIEKWNQSNWGEKNHRTFYYFKETQRTHSEKVKGQNSKELNPGVGSGSRKPPHPGNAESPEKFCPRLPRGSSAHFRVLGLPLGIAGLDQVTRYPFCSSKVWKWPDQSKWGHWQPRGFRPSWRAINILSNGKCFRAPIWQDLSWTGKQWAGSRNYLNNQAKMSVISTWNDEALGLKAPVQPP